MIKILELKYYKYILSIIAILMMLINFDHRIDGLEGSYSSTIDEMQYINLTDYFKGNTVIDSIRSPYNARPLTPIIAAKLPCNSAISLEIVSCIGQLSTIFIAFALFFYLYKSIFLANLGITLITFSYPVLFLTSIPRVDALSLMFIWYSIYFIVKRNYLAMFITLLLGLSAKETAIIVIPFYFIYNYNWKYKLSGNIKTIISTVILVSASLFFLIFLRNYFSTKSPYLWKPDEYTLWFNLSRFDAYLSLIITLFQFFIITIINRKYINIELFTKDNLAKATSIGVISVFAIFIYSFFSAYPDGRFLWIGYPFFTILCLEQIKKRSLS
jgi:hypothetical protein